jgi:hypothetical protein
MAAHGKVTPTGQQNLDVLHGRGKAMQAMYDNVHLTEDVPTRE